MKTILEIQKLDRQIVELINFGIKKENIITDQQSGKDFDRENYIENHFL